MGRIQSSVGLVTGIPIQDTVAQLMTIEAKPRDALTAKQQQYQAEQAAVTQLTALTLGVQLAAKQLEKPDLFAGLQTTSSDSTLLTAATSSGAAPGQYQFIPAQLAQTNHALSSGVAASDQALGGGTFSFRFGGQVNTAIKLADLNGGRGVARGQIKITDRSGASSVVDLRFAQSIDDVVSAINSTSGASVQAATDGDHIVLHDSSGGSGNLQVQDVGGGTTAADLGLGGVSAAANDVSGQNVVSLFNGLSLNELRDGNGLSLRTALPDLNVTFHDGSSPLNIDLNPIGQSAPQTLGDLLNRINAADPTRLKAQISADGKRIELKDLTTGSGTFAVTSPVGGSLAEELGLTGAANGDTITGGRLISGLKTTLLSSLNGGDGVGTLGTIQLTDRSGHSATVNLAGAATLDDVIDSINAAGLGIKAAYNSAQNGIALTDTTGASASNLIVADGDGTNAATKLGLKANVATTAINSGNLSRQTVSRNTLLSSYNGGQGVSLGTISVTNSKGVKTQLNLAALKPQTIGDVIDDINGSGIGVTAAINDAGDGITVTDSAGTGTLTIADVGSGRSAAGLHIAGTGATATVNNQTVQRIDGSTTVKITLAASDTLDDLVSKINALQGGATASVLSENGSAFSDHLSLLSNVSGKAGELLIDGSGLGLTFNDLTTGQDALLQVGGTGGAGVVLTSSTNKFSSVAPGLDVTLAGASTKPVTVTVAQTSDDTATAIQAFVDQYNKLRTQLDTYDSFDPTAGTKGTLFGSPETLQLDSNLSNAVTGTYFSSDSIHSLAELGVSVDDQGKLSFDKNAFQATYNDNPQAVTDFFSDKTNGFATKVDSMLESLVGENNSVLVNRASSLQTQIDDLGKRVTDWNTRLSNEQDRLLNEFYNMELAVSSIRNNLTYINQIQYISMNGSSSTSSSSSSSTASPTPSSSTTTSG